jgi:hypothetical protein
MANKIVVVSMGGTRGFRVYWTKDGNMWFLEHTSTTRTKSQVETTVERLKKMLPDVEVSATENKRGMLPEELLTSSTAIMRVGGMEQLPKMSRKARRRIQRAALPREPRVPSLVVDTPGRHYDVGAVKAVEVRKGTNLLSLSIRLGDDRPTVKTAPEWKRFMEKYDDVKNAVTQWVQDVERNEADRTMDFEKRVQEEVERRLKEQQSAPARESVTA